VSKSVFEQFITVFNVVGAAPVVRSFTSDVRVRDGHSVQLNCHSTGQPKPQIVWFRNNDSYTPPSNRDVRITKSATDFTLYLDFALFAISGGIEKGQNGCGNGTKIT